MPFPPRPIDSTLHGVVDYSAGSLLLTAFPRLAGIDGTRSARQVRIAFARPTSRCSVKLDPSVVNPSDVEMLEDLIAVAVAEVQKKAQALQQEETGKLTGGLGLPFKLPF